MKYLLLILVFLLGSNQGTLAQTSSDKVLICNSTTAKKYHKSQCSGLDNCTHSISSVTKSEAAEIGRTPCLICYHSTSSTNDTGSSYSTPKNSSTSGGCSAVQCGGTTQKGARCKNRTTNCSRRCYHHD